MGLIESKSLLSLVDAHSRNHHVIANNLANLSTPGYKTGRLRFKQSLDRLLDAKGGLRTGERIQTEIHRPNLGGAGVDGNNVRLEREIVELNKNSLRLELYLAVLGSRIRRIRSAIDGR